jgi:hypothetical protein
MEAAMHSSKELEFHDEAVKITWCACELCSAVAPRFMTLVKNHCEYTVELSPQCCDLSVEDEFVSGEARHLRNRPPLRNQIRR